MYDHHDARAPSSTYRLDIEGVWWEDCHHSHLNALLIGDVDRLP